MAGGIHAAVVPCLHGAARSVRTGEGIENDQYRCERGRVFGIDWAYDGPPNTPQWPPSEQ